MRLASFPHYTQLDATDCGPTALRIIARHHGKSYSLAQLRELCYKGRQGVSMLSLSDAAEEIGLHTIAVKITFEELRQEAPMPCLVHWNQDHFVVVYKIKGDKVYVSDPASGLVVYSREEFSKGWCSTKQRGEGEGIALLVEPTPDFYTHQLEEQPDKTSFSFLVRYFTPQRKLITQLLLALLASNLFPLISPFITQALVDSGINNGDLGLVYLILIAQLMLFVGSSSVEIIRSYIMLHLSTRLNIAILSDFLAKLTRLPIAFFEARNLGDIMQRIDDNGRIQSFLTSSTLGIIFPMFNLVVYSIVMLYYNASLFFIFLIGSSLYFGWILLFLKKRKQLDYKRFNASSSNQSTTIHLIQGMQEIKLQNCEKQKRWEWERIQARLFKISLQSMNVGQLQSGGSTLINQLMNITITFWAAKEVIEGNMTLGMMMAATQILGQLSGPIHQFIGFVQQAQDANISLERLGEVHNRKDENQGETLAEDVPAYGEIVLEGVNFRYGDPNGPLVLNDVSLSIPRGKVTAIVGASGSGKTTLLKLLLKFYEPEGGSLKLGETPLAKVDNRWWRGQCGVVMQDGYIFSDTIARNIAVADEVIDKKKLVLAAEVANIREHIESLPLNYNTKIGAEGAGLSQGQKQRIMIARAVYKDPEYILFDEATSALDANNEKEITEKLGHYLYGKTAVIIAHRLSTVKHAHQIVVMDQGQVKEIGTHQELIERQGLYYNLVKNQLDLEGEASPV